MSRPSEGSLVWRSKELCVTCKHGFIQQVFMGLRVCQARHVVPEHDAVERTQGARGESSGVLCPHVEFEVPGVEETCRLNRAPASPGVARRESV